MNKIAIESGMAVVVTGVTTDLVDITGPDVEEKDKTFHHQYRFVNPEQKECLDLELEDEGTIIASINGDVLFEEGPHKYVDFKRMVKAHIQELNRLCGQKYFYIEHEGTYIDINNEKKYKDYLESMKENV